jgi:hypothetical protein
MSGTITEYDVLETMEHLGGSFVVQLARLYRLGDMENQAKLRSTFSNYFTQYRQLAEHEAARCAAAKKG